MFIYSTLCNAIEYTRYCSEHVSQHTFKPHIEGKLKQMNEQKWNEIKKWKKKQKTNIIIPFYFDYWRSFYRKYHKITSICVCDWKFNCIPRVMRKLKSINAFSSLSLSRFCVFYQIVYSILTILSDALCVCVEYFLMDFNGIDDDDLKKSAYKCYSCVQFIL